MSDLSEKFISVKKYGNLKDYREESVSEEVIEIENFTRKEAFEMEKHGFFFMPNKITYARKTVDFDSLVKELSKRKRQYLKKYIENSKVLDIVKSRPIDEKIYKKWYKEVYVPEITSKEHGAVLAEKDWCNIDLDSCEKVGIFFKDGEKFVAGAVSRSYPKDVYPKRLSISYYATGDKFKDLGVNFYLNLLMIDLASKCGYKDIFIGKDTNLYGKHLNSGVSIFKMSIGYEILAHKKNPDMLIKFNNLDEFGDVLFFASYAKDSDKLIGNVILNNIEKSVDEYKRSFFLKLRVFNFVNGKLKLLEELDL